MDGEGRLAVPAPKQAGREAGRQAGRQETVKMALNSAGCSKGRQACDCVKVNLHRSSLDRRRAEEQPRSFSPLSWLVQHALQLTGRVGLLLGTTHQFNPLPKAGRT